jgi:hypothetical protein
VQDAAWLLPSSEPLKCTSPADVYMLLKSSDFVTHDLAPESVFADCSDGECAYELELVLRKWYAVERNRELRCFVRDGMLLGAHPLMRARVRPSCSRSLQACRSATKTTTSF